MNETQVVENSRASHIVDSGAPGGDRSNEFDVSAFVLKTIQRGEKLTDPINAAVLRKFGRDPEDLQAKADKSANECCKSEHHVLPRLTIEELAEELHVRGIVVKQNILSGEMEISGCNVQDDPEQLAKHIPILLFNELGNEYKGASVENIQNFLSVIASRARFNPVLDALAAVEWDGRDHIADICDSILCLPPSDDLSRVLVKKWLWQGASLLRNDFSAPFGADGVLVLNGAQGIGKTSFFRWLAVNPRWFRGGQSIDPRDKDTLRRAVTAWIVELGELEATLRSDVERLKSFITAELDEYRVAYGRVDERRVRRTNLCGTCNQTGFLLDATGNRRFWTVHADKIDFEAMRHADAVQAWAQAFVLSAQDLQGFRLTRDEQAALTVRNGNYEKPLKGEEEVRDIISEEMAHGGQPTPLTVNTFKLRHDTLHAYSVQQIGCALDRCGYSSTRITINGVTQRARMIPHRALTCDERGWSSV